MTKEDLVGIVIFLALFIMPLIWVFAYVGIWDWWKTQTKSALVKEKPLHPVSGSEDFVTWCERTGGIYINGVCHAKKSSENGGSITLIEGSITASGSGGYSGEVKPTWALGGGGPAFWTETIRRENGDGTYYFVYKDHPAAEMTVGSNIP